MFTKVTAIILPTLTFMVSFGYSLAGKETAAIYLALVAIWLRLETSRVRIVEKT